MGSYKDPAYCHFQSFLTNASSSYLTPRSFLVKICLMGLTPLLWDLNLERFQVPALDRAHESNTLRTSVPPVPSIPAQSPAPQAMSPQSAPAGPTVRLAHDFPNSPASTSTRNTALIRANSVSVFYGDVRGDQDGLDRHPPSNSVVGFIGPSGCGKSTFLRSINRLNDLIPGCRVTGDLRIGGRNIYDAARRPGQPSPAGRAGLPEAQSLPQESSTKISPMAPGFRESATARPSTRSSRTASARPRSGTRPRTGSRAAPWACPADSSSDFASPAPWPPGPRSC